MLKKWMSKMIDRMVTERLQEVDFSEIINDNMHDIVQEVHEGIDLVELAENIDTSDLAQEISVSDVAYELDTSDLAREVADEISAYDVAQEMDVSDIAQEVDHYDIASAIVSENAYDIMRELEMSDLAQSIDMSDLAKHVIDDLDMGELAGLVAKFIDPKPILEHLNMDFGTLADKLETFTWQVYEGLNEVVNTLQSMNKDNKEE